MKIMFTLFSFLVLLSLVNAQTKLVHERKFKRHFYFKVNQFKALPNTKDEIIFLGNSITAGGNWSELFQDIRMKNRGISGDVTEGILFRLDEITESKPSKIFIMIGINDLSKGLSIDSILTNYKIILNKISDESPNTNIYIQSILPVNNRYSVFKNHVNKGDSILIINRKLKRIADSFNLTYIDLFSSFADADGRLKDKYTLDGLHLKGRGYWLWKDNIEEYIKDK